MLHNVRSTLVNRQFLKLNLVLVVLLLLGALSASAQDAITSSPTMVSQAWLPGLSISDPFAESLLIIEFPPGGGVPLHTHGGAHVVTVLDGAVTVVEDGTETVYEAGESFTEMPGHVHEAFNAGEVPAHVVATWLLTEGAARTTLEGDGASDRPAITVISQADYPDITMNGLFVELVRVLDFAPGAGVPFHHHGGPHLVLVLEGAITVTDDMGTMVFEAGESFTEPEGHIHQAMNAGDVPARVAATWLLSIAAPTTLQP